MRTLPGILLLVATLAGCADTKKASPQPPASGTSVMAIVSSGSSYKIYLPAHESPTVTHAVVTVVNAAAPHGSSGLIRHVDLGVTGTARAVGAAGEDVVVSGESIPSVFFIDAASDTVRGSAPLPASSQLIVASGGLSYTAGVAVDQAQRKAYVSTSTGFAAYDVDTRLPAGQFAAPTPENFTLDPASQRLYAPFYLCDQSFPDGADICTAYQQPGGPALTDSLTVVDLASGDAFSLVDPAAAEPWAPLGLEVDAAALDPGLGVLALAVEFPPTLQVLDLAAATFDATALTCRMPGLTIALPDDLLTSVAVDPVTHILVAAREQSDTVYFVDLAQAKQGTLADFVTTMPPLPGGGLFLNHGDPHGALVGVVDGRPYAFLVTEDHAWIARIDLMGVAKVLAGTGTLADHVAYISVPAP